LLQERAGFTYYVLSNLVVLFPPPNTISQIQILAPLDQGIISAFKAHYRRYVVDWTIKQHDKPENAGEDLSKVKRDFLQMLTWCKKAWNELSVETLRNCWRKSGLFPNLIPAPLHRKERASRKRVAALNHDEVMVEADSEAPGPSNRVNSQAADSEQEDEEDAMHDGVGMQCECWTHAFSS
jgi:hypothetical protein